MLFCKPSRKAGIIYEETFGQGQTLIFRSLRMQQDLPIIQHWAPSSYWREFWVFQQYIENIVDIYQAVQKNPDSHCIVGLLDEQLVAQIDLYKAAAADFGKHVPVTFNDTMVRFQIKSSLLSPQAVIQAFQCWYFNFPYAGNLYAEPDIHNHVVCRMLEATGFIFQRNLILTHKAASIYLLTKKRYLHYLAMR